MSKRFSIAALIAIAALVAVQAGLCPQCLSGLCSSCMPPEPVAETPQCCSAANTEAPQKQSGQCGDDGRPCNGDCEMKQSVMQDSTPAVEAARYTPAASIPAFAQYNQAPGRNLSLLVFATDGDPPPGVHNSIATTVLRN